MEPIAAPSRRGGVRRHVCWSHRGCAPCRRRLQHQWGALGRTAPKKWYDSVFVLGKASAEWHAGFKLPRPLGYGVSVTMQDGLICIGGSDSTHHFTEVFRLQSSVAVRALFGVRAFWLLLVLNVFFGITNWGISAWLPTYLRERFHLGLGAAGLSATGYIQAASFLGVLGGGVSADRWSRTNP